jgi:hypothetical protein
MISWLILLFSFNLWFRWIGLLFFQIFMAWKDKLLESGVGWGGGRGEIEGMGILDFGVEEVNWLVKWFVVERNGVGKFVLQWIFHKDYFLETFWVKKVFCNWPYNSLYFYIVSVIRQIAWVVRVATHYICSAIQCNLITTLSKQLIFNYYAIPLQLQP